MAYAAAAFNAAWSSRFMSSSCCAGFAFKAAASEGAWGCSGVGWGQQGGQGRGDAVGQGSGGGESGHKRWQGGTALRWAAALCMDLLVAWLPGGESHQLNARTQHARSVCASPGHGPAPVYPVLQAQQRRCPAARVLSEFVVRAESGGQGGGQGGAHLATGRRSGLRGYRNTPLQLPLQLQTR